MSLQHFHLDLRAVITIDFLLLAFLVFATPAVDDHSIAEFEKRITKHQLNQVAPIENWDLTVWSRQSSGEFPCSPPDQVPGNNGVLRFSKKSPVFVTCGY